MTVVELPADEGERLRELRNSDRTEFLRRVGALTRANWPLRAIGEPLNVGRSTVKAWAVAAESLDVSDVQVPVRVKLSVVRLRPDVPVEDRAKLRELTQLARSVNRWTAENAPERVASRELDEMLVRYTDRDVSVRTLADRMGVTYRAVVARLERRAEKHAEAV